jgi:hypothetical protein
MNELMLLSVRNVMKLILFGFSLCLLSSCATDSPDLDGDGRNRVGHGNADLQGPSADSVIRRSTHQWHADRYYDESRRSRR